MLSPVSAYGSQTSLPEIPLGHRPSLQNLRDGVGTRCFVRLLLRYRRCQIARRSACKDCGHGPSFAVPPNHPAGTAKLSRFSNIERPRMLRVSDSAGPDNDWPSRAAVRGAFPVPIGSGSAPRMGDFGARWLAYAPLSTLHVRPRGRPGMTRGSDGVAPPFT